MYTALLLTCLSLFFAFPGYTELHRAEWQELFIKAQHPFTNSLAGAGSHDAKITFRLLIPLIVHALHLDITGVLIFTGIIGILNFYLVLHIAYKILRDKRLAIIIGLCSCFIYFGKCSFIELRGGMFDGIAMCLLLLSIATPSNILKGIFIFFCAWCDERGLIASSLVWVYILYEYRNSPFIKKVLNGAAISLYIAWLLYAITRYWLVQQYGLQTDVGGTGPKVLFNQVNNIPIGIWSALEGLWLPVIYAFLALYRDRSFFELLKFMGACILILIVGVSVLDITRSVMYVFPAVFIALSILKDKMDKPALEKLLFYSLILCFVYPAYYTGGKSSIWWTYPLPLQLLRPI